MSEVTLSDTHFEQFVAEEGDQCDACGKLMHEGELFYQDGSVAIRWRFCTIGCAHTGATSQSDKARFVARAFQRLAHA